MQWKHTAWQTESVLLQTTNLHLIFFHCVPLDVLLLTVVKYCLAFLWSNFASVTVLLDVVVMCLSSPFVPFSAHSLSLWSFCVFEFCLCISSLFSLMCLCTVLHFFVFILCLSGWFISLCSRFELRSFGSFLVVSHFVLILLLLCL